MASTPAVVITHRSMLQFVRVGINSDLLAAPIPPALSENLLHRSVYNYDFSCERKFLDTAHAELQEMKESAARKETGARARLASSSSTTSSTSRYSSTEKPPRTADDDQEYTRPRSSTAEDVAAAISASLKEY